MRLYKCIICNDEMFADTFKMKVSDGGIFYEVEGKRCTRTEQFDESLISANNSAEEVTESAEASSSSGVDIVLNHNLKETTYTKKEYVAYLKTYVKKIRDKLAEDNPEKAEEFMTKTKAEISRITQNFKDFQFFTGESMDPDGMVALLDYREDGITPYMLFFKDGLESEKC